MKTNGDTVTLEKFLRPMARGLSPELARALINLTADEGTQARYDALAGKRTEAQLTQAELEELESFVRVNTLRGVLKVEAQAVLVKAARRTGQARSVTLRPRPCDENGKHHCRCTVSGTRDAADWLRAVPVP